MNSLKSNWYYDGYHMINGQLYHEEETMKKIMCLLFHRKYQNWAWNNYVYCDLCMDWRKKC